MQTLSDFFKDLGIDAFVALAFIAGVIMSFLTSKQKSLKSRLCNAIACGIFASSLVPVLQYLGLPENLSVFLAVSVGYFGVDSCMDFIKAKLSSLLSIAMKGK